VSLECGRRAGGHGHPDLLHLTLYWDRVVLTDPGTGSYVSPTLHWYRSTLAHNAPGLAGVGQVSRAGFCTAFEAGERWSWMQAKAQRLFGPGTSAMRSIVVGPYCVIDIVDIVAPESVLVDLPIHPVAGVELSPELKAKPASLSPGPQAGHEHGY